MRSSACGASAHNRSAEVTKMPFEPVGSAAPHQNTPGAAPAEATTEAASRPNAHPTHHPREHDDARRRDYRVRLLAAEPAGPLPAAVGAGAHGSGGGRSVRLPRAAARLAAT